MDSDNDSYHFPKCQTHAYTRFENGCSENSAQKLLTKYSIEENNKHVICRPRSVRIGNNCALGLGYSRPLAQFFPIRTSRPTNNIYLFSSGIRGTKSIYVDNFPFQKRPSFGNQRILNLGVT